MRLSETFVCVEHCLHLKFVAAAAAVLSSLATHRLWQSKRAGTGRERKREGDGQCCYVNSRRKRSNFEVERPLLIRKLSHALEGKSLS